MKLPCSLHQCPKDPSANFIFGIAFFSIGLAFCARNKQPASLDGPSFSFLLFIFLSQQFFGLFSFPLNSPPFTLLFYVSYLISRLIFFLIFFFITLPFLLVSFLCGLPQILHLPCMAARVGEGWIPRGLRSLMACSLSYEHTSLTLNSPS